MKSGELDIAILALPYPVKGLHAFEFWQEDFYYVSSINQSVTPKIKASQIKPEQLMLLQDGHCLKEWLLATCSLPASALHKSVSGTSLYTLVANDGWEYGRDSSAKNGVGVLGG